MKGLSLRLSTLAGMVPPNASVADVGSDHCLLPIALSSRKDIPFLQAIDNKKGPYLTMEQAVLEANLSDRIALSLSDGLSCLDEKVDTIVLAGMGGRRIYEILSRGKDRLGQVKTILLDAHKDLLFIRKKLIEFGFVIDEEVLIQEDGVYYALMRFVRGKDPNYSQADYLFGPIIRQKKEKIYYSFLFDNKERIKAILKKDIPLSERNRYGDLLSLIDSELSRRPL